MSAPSNGMLLECCRCNRVASHSLLRSVESEVDYRDADGVVNYDWAAYHLFQCEGCSQVSLYLISPFNLPESEFGERVYPEKEERLDHPEIPRIVRDAYREAEKVKNYSNIAYAVMARRVLEVIAVDRGISESNLARALSVLSDRCDVPRFMMEAATLIRKFGNSAAHSEAIEIEYLHTVMMDRFLLFLIDIVYVYPNDLRGYRHLFDVSGE